MDGAVGHCCAHIGYTGQGETSEDGEMNEMALPSRLKIGKLKVRYATYRSRMFPTISNLYE